MMKIFAGIIGILLLIPIAITLVGLIIFTLIGGYAWLVLSALWEMVITIALIIIVYKIIKHFDKKNDKK